MKCNINPLIDCVFKKLFSSEENKHLLLSLVNSIISINQPPIVSLEILNPYNIKKYTFDKLSIIDIKAKDKKGDFFLVEVQVEMFDYFPQRLLYYWARQYTNQLKEGERYHNLHKVSVISFCAKNLPLALPETEFLHCFKILEYQKYIPFYDDLNIYTIELPKFDITVNDILSDMHRWLYFLKHARSLDDTKLPASLDAPFVQHVLKECTMFTQDEIQRGLYESQLKAQLDYDSAMEERTRKSMQKGMQKGIKEGIKKTAKKALKAGFDLKTVKKITGLTLEEIRSIQESMK